MTFMHVALGVVIGALAAGATLAIAAWGARRHVEGTARGWLAYPASLAVVALGFATALAVHQTAVWAFAVALFTVRFAGLGLIRRAM